MPRLIADAKDVEEASAFAIGDGQAPNPEGLITGSTILVDGASSAVGVSDLYDVQAALPPRWQGRASWVGSLATKQAVRRLVASADPNEPQLFDPTGQNLLGGRYVEASALDEVATGAKPLAYGSVQDALTIIDVVGMAVELVPHVFGPTSARPASAVSTPGTTTPA